MGRVTSPDPYRYAAISYRLGGCSSKFEWEAELAIYRTLYYGDVSVGVGGRITIPQDMRDDMGIAEGDALTVRVEENPDGGRQMVLWRDEQQPEEE